jgi:hypothetical protein
VDTPPVRVDPAHPSEWTLRAPCGHPAGHCGAATVQASMTDRADGAGSTPATGAGCPDTADPDGQPARPVVESWPGSWATATTTTSSRAGRPGPAAMPTGRAVPSPTRHQGRPSDRLDRAQPPGLGAVARPELLGAGEQLRLGRGRSLLVGIGSGRHGVEVPAATRRPGRGPAGSLGRRTSGQGAGPARLRSRAATQPASQQRSPSKGCQPAAPPDPTRPTPGLRPVTMAR